MYFLNYGKMQTFEKNKKISIRINRIEKHYNIIEIEMKKFHPNQIGFSLCKI